MGENYSPSMSAIIHYFKQKRCNKCHENFESQGIKLLKQEDKVIVVQVDCSACGHCFGTAVVAMNHADVPQKSPYPSTWNKRDIKRLSKFDPITSDDVLAAHEFLQNLQGDWAKHLPKISGRKAL